jgi:ABC-type multidrug transport system fused ATPase/permease subunit
VAFNVDAFGVEMDSITYLFAACGVFLFLVLVNQGFKYVINIYRGLTGERMLRRLRYDLYGRVLRFPQPTFRKVSQGEVIQMINAEVEPLGGFFGEAYSWSVGYLNGLVKPSQAFRKFIQTIPPVWNSPCFQIG